MLFNMLSENVSHSNKQIFMNVMVSFTCRFYMNGTGTTGKDGKEKANVDFTANAWTCLC